MKKNLSMLMGALLILAWYVTVSSWFGNDQKYNNAIEEAHRLEEKELYLDAISKYEEAKSVKGNSLEVDEYIADDYLSMGNQKEYRKQLDYIIAHYGPVDRDVRKLYEYYESYLSERSLIDCITNLYKKYPDSEIVKEFYNSIKGRYTELYCSFDYIMEFHGKYATFESGGRQGLLDEDGKIIIEPVYEEIIFDGSNENRILVWDDGKYFFVTKEGYKTMEPDTEYEYLGSISEKRIVAKKNGKYGYLDSSLREKTDFIYDDATAIYEGIGAIKKGDKWALISRQGKEITDFIFDDVVTNGRNICSINKVIGVKQNGVYFLVNEKGEKVGENTFQDMKAFESEQPCAVFNHDKWGFMDEEGNLVIDYRYHDAKSFVNGYAPVRKNQLWGYIDLDNFEAVESRFDDAGYFTVNGVAPIAHGNAWTLIQLKVND